jgi:hypothetical protein
MQQSKGQGPVQPRDAATGASKAATLQDRVARMKSAGPSSTPTASPA